MEAWYEERKTWTETCRRLQGEVSTLTLQLKKKDEFISRLRSAHVEELLAKDVVLSQLDKEMQRLIDENRVLELEIALLRSGGKQVDAKVKADVIVVEKNNGDGMGRGVHEEKLGEASWNSSNVSLSWILVTVGVLSVGIEWLLF